MAVRPSLSPGQVTGRGRQLAHTLDTLDAMTSHKTTQTMKPATAAKKLGVYLEATPAEFQEGVVSRDELNALQANPPEWLRELRRNGPHPRPVVAAKLGVSIAGLARGGITDPLTTEQIEALKAERPGVARAGARHPGRGPQGSGAHQGSSRNPPPPQQLGDQPLRTGIGSLFAGGPAARAWAAGPAQMAASAGRRPVSRDFTVRAKSFGRESRMTFAQAEATCFGSGPVV